MKKNGTYWGETRLTGVSFLRLLYDDTIRHDHAYNIILLLILAGGIFLRAHQYAFNRSLWLDEAMLAINIVDRSYLELSQVLSYNQGAPLGFLFIQKLFVTLFGNTEYVLRAFPFIASLLSLLLIYYVAHTYTKGIGTIALVLLFSVNSWLIYYASECKQYSSDVMVALLLLLCAHKCMGSEIRFKIIATLTVVGCISLWLSHPALFILSSIGLVVMIDIFEKKHQGNRKWLVLMLLIWAANFIVLYLISFRRLESNPVFLSYWNKYFMPMPPWQDLSWFPTVFFRMLTKPVGLSMRSISSLLILVGSTAFAMRNRRTAIIIIMPLVLTIGASGFKKYPFGDRLLLFAVPFILLYAAEGIEQVRSFIAKKYAVAAFWLCLCMTIVIAFSHLNHAVHTVQYPENNEDLKAVLKYVENHKEGTDLIYVYYGAIPAFKYYYSKFSLHTFKIIGEIEPRENPHDYKTDLVKLKGKKRVWFVFSHNYTRLNIDEDGYIVHSLSTIGSKLDEIKSANASAYLFNL